MSTLNPETDKYRQSAQQFQEAYNKYMGESGLNRATDYAQNMALKNAQISALASSENAGNQARVQARNAGLTKAQSAMLGANAGANQYASQFGNAYNNLYSQGLSGALANNQSTVNQALTEQKLAQQEGQSEYDRTWQNVERPAEIGGKTVGSIVKGLMSM